MKVEEKVQKPVYFVSHTLADAETRYSLIEKGAYAVIIAARKLRPYFDSHQVIVLTNMPLEKSLEKIEKSGRMAKWAVELTGYGVKYQPRTAIKGQALADFLAECSYHEEDPTPSRPLWELHTDGSATAQGAGAGIVLVSPEGSTIEYALKFSFPATNNEAEYEAVIAGLELCRTVEARRVKLMTDSQLVVNQVKGEYETREPSMVKYLAKVKELIKKFDEVVIEQLPRSQNLQADALSKLGSSSVQELARSVHVEIKPTKAISPNTPSILSIEVDNLPTWQQEIISYLKEGVLPEDRMRARKVKCRAHNFVLINEELYKKSFTQPLLKCVNEAQAKYILAEIHEGLCGHHLGGKALAEKALRAGYYWPTAERDAIALVLRCDHCQRHSPSIKLPGNNMKHIHNPIPFAQWGLDIIGAFKPAVNNKKWIIVGVDYFTKWVEAEPITSISEPQVRNFIRKNIITRFGLPRVLVFDRGLQFDCKDLKDYLQPLGIKLAYASVCNPKCNGQAEAANKTIINGLKKRLEGHEAKGKWVEELSNVLWSLRTTKKEATGHSPFNLVYGSEAVLPIENAVPTLRIAQYNEEENDEALMVNLDLLDERREEAARRLSIYQDRVTRQYNRRVKHRPLRVGDMVLRNAEATYQGQRLKTKYGKLAARWEGPYRIAEDCGYGTYYLAFQQGEEWIPMAHKWNINNLRKYYP